MEPLYGCVFAAFTLFSFGLYVAAPDSSGSSLADIAFPLIAALLWPITLPIWVGTAVRSIAEKYIRG